jgi:hypothetical protein
LTVVTPFDAVWVDWETETWRLLGFVSQPVQYNIDYPFDDVSNRHFRFSTVRIEHHVLGRNELSAYYALYQRDNAQYLNARGDEQRHILDVRFAGRLGSIDWDLGDGTGRLLGPKGDPRLGGRLPHRLYVQRPAVAAEGRPPDRRGLRQRPPGQPGPRHLNPLFSNGCYFSLAATPAM